MSLLMFFLTILGLILAIIKIIFALKVGDRNKARITFVRLTCCLLIYLTMLLAVSLTSNERVLGYNREKRFCGCYLDCHLSASVIDLELSKDLKNGETTVSAEGNFLIVAVKVTNKAKYASLKLNNPKATIVDKNGRRFHRVLSAEALLTQDGIDPLNSVLPPNTSAIKKLVFDLPNDVKKPYLSIKEGDRLTRLSELFIIGDEDSLLHKETKFLLMPPARIIFHDDEL